MSDIQFKISSDSQQAQRDLNKLNKSVQGIENTARSTADSISSLAKSVAGVVAGFSFASVVQKTSDSFIQLNTRLSLSIDNMGELIRVQQDLVKISQSTRTSIESTTEVFSGLAKSLKKPSSEILKITDTIQKASIVSGGSADSIKAALTQLNQGLQSGTLRGEELNSVFEQTPRLARAIADGLGVSLGELRSLAQEGKVTTEAIFDALSSQSQQISDEFEKVGLTVSQSLLKIKDIAGLTLGEIFTETGKTPNIAKAISVAADIIAENRNLIVTSAVIISANIQNIIGTAANLGRAVAPLFTQLGLEIKRLIPVVSFLQLQLGANLNISFLKLYTEESIRLKAILTETATAFRKTLQFFGVDYKSDFFTALSKVALSKSIPELEKNIKGLVEVIKDPDLTSFKGWWKLISGDVKIGTALLDALNYREIVKFLMPFREFLASIGVLQNSLITLGNVRFDKISSLISYFEEIQRLFSKLGKVIFDDIVIAFQLGTQTIGSYLIEIGRQFSGLPRTIFQSVGRFIFELSGFSSATEKMAIIITNTLLALGASSGLGVFNKFGKATDIAKNSFIKFADDVLRITIDLGVRFRDSINKMMKDIDFSSLTNTMNLTTRQKLSDFVWIFKDAIHTILVYYSYFVYTLPRLISKVLVLAQNMALTDLILASLSNLAEKLEKKLNPVKFVINKFNDSIRQSLEELSSFARGIQGVFIIAAAAISLAFKGLLVAFASTELGALITLNTILIGDFAGRIIYLSKLFLSLNAFSIKALFGELRDVNSLKEVVTALKNYATALQSSSGLINALYLLSGASYSLRAALALNISFVENYIKKLGSSIASIGDKLEPSIAKIKNFGNKVKGIFLDIYDKVVGNSYWPDMVNGVISWTDTLVSQATKRLSKFSNSVIDIFSNLSNKKFSFGDFSEGVTDALSINAESLERAARIASSAVIGGILASMISPAAFGTFIALVGVNIAKNLGLALEGGLRSVFNFSIIEEVGRSLGATFASLLKSAVSEIPSIIGAIVSFSSGFIDQLLSDLGLVGKGLKGLLNVLTLGETGIIPLLIFGVVGFDQITKQIADISKSVGGLISSSATSKLTQESIIKRIFGDKVDVAFAVAGITALLSVFTKEVNIVQAAFVATPLLATAILGRDVAGKILVDTVKNILIKITALINAQTAGSSVLQNMFSRLFNNNAMVSTVLANAKSTIAKVFDGIKRVTDEERKKSFLAGGLSLSEFMFGSKAGMKSGFSAADFSMSGAGMDKDMFSNFTKTAKGAADSAAAAVKPKSSLLKDIILGSKPEGINYAFSGYVNTASTIAKEAANDIGKNTILNAATGMNTANKVKAELDLFLEFIKGKFASLANLGAMFGPAGAIGKVLFGKVGSVIALTGLLAIFTSEAKAGVMDIASTVANYALEGGLLGWLLLSSTSVRGGIASAFKFVLKQFGLLKDAALMGPSNKVSWISKLIPLLTGTAALAVGTTASLLGLIYILGDGETVAIKFGDGLRKSTNKLIEFVTGIKDAIPRAIQEFSQFEQFSKRVSNISKNLEKINPDFSAKYNSASSQFSLKFISGKEVTEFTNLSKAIEKAIKGADTEIQELGAVSEKTSENLKTLLNRYEKFSERVSQKQGVDLSLDANLAVLNFQAEPAMIQKSVLGLAAEISKVAVSALSRVVAYPLDFIYNWFAFPFNELFDANIAYGFFTNFGQKLGLILSGDESAKIFTDWSNRLTDRIRTDVSYLGRDVTEAAAMINFAFQEFANIGKGDLLGDERQELVAAINRTAQARDDALKNLRNAEGFRGFFITAEERSQQKADIQQAKEELEAAIADYTAVATRARDVKIRNIEVTVFQRDIKELADNLDSLKISYDANSLFNTQDIPGIKDKVDRIKELQAQLRKTKDATEAIILNEEISSLKIDVALQLEKDASDKIKYQIETALKSANITGVNWVDLLNLGERSFNVLFDRIKNVGVLTKELEAARIGKDFEKATELANKIKLETVGITYELNAAKTASTSFADSLMNINFNALSTFSKVYTAPVKDQERLVELIREANNLQLQAQQIEASTNTGRAAIGEVDRFKKQLALRGKVVTEEIDKIRESFNPKKKEKEKEKTALEVLEEQLNKSNVKSKIDDVIKSGISLTDIVADLTRIGITLEKINNLPKGKGGLPTDLVSADKLKKTLDGQIKAFDDKVSPKTLNATFTELFKFSPDLLDKSFGDLTSETLTNITEISKDIEKALDQKYDPSKTLLENLLNFSKNKTIIKTKTEEAGRLLGVSLKDVLSSLNVDLSDYITYDAGIRSKVLDLTKKIIQEEDKIKELQTKNATQANLDERARAELRKKNLEKERKELLTPNTLGKQAALLGLDLTVLLGLDEGKKNKLIKTRLDLEKINQRISDNQLLEGETLEGLIAYRAVLLEQEKQINDERARQQSLQQTFLGQGKTLLSDIFKGKEGAFKSFFNSFTGSVVDNFTNQLGDYLFKDISKVLGDSLGLNMFGVELGSTAGNAMWVRSADVGDKLSKLGGSGMANLGSALSNGNIGSFFGQIGGWFSELFSPAGPAGAALLGMPGFADGGLVTAYGSGATPVIAHAGELILNEAQQARVAAAMNQPAQQMINVNITGDISRQTKSEIYRMLPSIAEGVNSHNREKGLR